MPQNPTTTPDRATTVTSVINELKAVLDYELPELTEQSKIFEELGLDSTGVFELMMRLEEALEIEFDTDSLEMGHFETVGTLTDFVLGESGS
ncbi:acyl carrier protein [Saccharopolyspora sp. NFXS83]|uniref:acyl carrier protein n=1 Tax=Saccharopolyspora sp. NFXS83 TaxID=2993560 RepID=UPI00224B0DEF|nr:acyl carrier protein [Saccharopolyspora sp. NFXS83]MCX2732055.1 acyl carrier protein [Saccharopolyspora sp. NFXS83]